jgi:hypothetical protein
VVATHGKTIPKIPPESLVQGESLDIEAIGEDQERRPVDSVEASARLIEEGLQGLEPHGEGGISFRERTLPEGHGIHTGFHFHRGDKKRLFVRPEGLAMMGEPEGCPRERFDLKA